MSQKLRVAIVVVLLSVAAAAAAPSAGAVTRYGLQGGCYALQAENGQRVIQSGAGYRLADRAVASAAHFRMQATALGRYMLYDALRQMPAVSELPQLGTPLIGLTKNPGPAADWIVSGAGNRGFKLRSVKTGRALGSTSAGLALVDTEDRLRFQFLPTTNCLTFPEMTDNATGTPSSGVDVNGEVGGFIDDHIHLMAFEFMGGYFHCGRPWSPYGVTVALADCEPAAEPSSLADNILAKGRPLFAPTNGGWPNFENWPRRDSLLREATYWKSLERAWKAGVRVMVNDLVQNYALCEIWPAKRMPCDDMTAVRVQYADTIALQDYIDAQYGGPGKGFFRVVRTPAAARRVVAAGKLAIVNSVETSAPFGCSQYKGTPRCTVADIDKGLDEWQRMGIVGFFPIHKFDNAFGGVHYDEATTGLLVGIGQNYSSGEWWNPQTCPAGQTDHDNTPTGLLNGDAYQLLALFGTEPGSVPVYPNGPLCNPRGLTDMGKYVINEMVRRGMIVETDHMSVKARRDTLDILEASKYPGLISSHSWGDPGSTKRLQALGGMVGPIVGGGSPGSNSLRPQWLEAKANARKDLTFGLGFGSDIGGLALQYGPDPMGPLNPGSKMTYPFKSYDGAVTFDRHTMGNRTYDYDVDGIAEYGLYADWLETTRRTAGAALMNDMWHGAEAYIELWQRTRATVAR